MQSTPPVRATLMLLPHRLQHAFFLVFMVTTIFFSTRPAANTTSYLYILEYTSVLMVFHRLGKPSALWTSVGRVKNRHRVWYGECNICVVVVSNVVGGCPVSLGVIKAAGVCRVSGSGMASAGYYPPGHQKRAVEDKPGQNSDKTFHFPTPAP